MSKLNESHTLDVYIVCMSVTPPRAGEHLDQAVSKSQGGGPPTLCRAGDAEGTEMHEAASRREIRDH